MNREKLDKIAGLLHCDMDKYNEAAKENKEEFIDFWYYYLSDNTDNFFHNIGEKGYVNSIKNFIKRNNIEIGNIDYEDFLSKESYYSEALCDILLAEVRYQLKDKSLDILGINIGYQSIMYYILPKNIIKQIKSMEEEAGILLFDIKKIEEIYGEIYKLNQLIPELDDVKESDFVEKNKENNTYITMFDSSIRQNYVIANLDTKLMEIYL